LYLAMARLMQTVQDTTALRRCGPPGLARLRRDGARLEGLLGAGADPVAFLIRANARYRRQRLTMGGVADLLGMSAAWTAFSAQPSGLPPATNRRQPA
ncbi:MAG: triphosphoribosyl-dephospho-CoA synthase, partial [Pseudomonadota bacterium]|nr:triphosphoribosyl-dephospho-CoA synthase [Pseudomonadota bacterium]